MNETKVLNRPPADDREKKWLWTQSQIVGLGVVCEDVEKKTRNFIGEFHDEFEHLNGVLGRVLHTQERQELTIEQQAEEIASLKRTLEARNIPTPAEIKIEALEKGLEEMTLRYDRVIDELDATRAEAGLPPLPAWNPGDPEGGDP